MPRETRDKAEMPKAKVYVFLDTNILIRTITQGMPGCEIESWEELKSLAEKNKVTLLVPEVVLLEVEKQWSSLGDDLARKYDEAHKKIQEQLKGLWTEARDLADSVLAHVADQKDKKAKLVYDHHAKVEEFLTSTHVKQIALTPEIWLRANKRKLAGRLKSPENVSIGDACIIDSLVTFFEQQGLGGATLLFCSENTNDFAVELEKEKRKFALHPRVTKGLPPTEYFVELKSLVKFIRERKEVHEPNELDLSEALEREKRQLEKRERDLLEIYTGFTTLTHKSRQDAIRDFYENRQSVDWPNLENIRYPEANLEQIRHFYEKIILDLEKQIENIRYPEANLEQIRHFYEKKILDLEKQIEEENRTKRVDDDTNADPG